MDKGIIICIGAILLFFYFFSPVPYCIISEKSFCVADAIYTLEEASKVKEITAIQLNVNGTSMSPTIQDGSECLCVKKTSYEVGDIIFFFAEINGNLKGISHRIVMMNGKGIVTKGDGNDFFDPSMTKESIVCAIPEIPRWKTFT